MKTLTLTVMMLCSKIKIQKIVPSAKGLDFSPNSAIFKILVCCLALRVKLALGQPSQMARHCQGPSCRPLYYSWRKRKKLLYSVAAPAAPGLEPVAVPEDLRSGQEQSRGVSSGKATPCHTRLIQGCPRGQDNPTCDLSRDIPTQVGIEKLFWDMQGWDSCNGISRDIPLW